MKEVQQLRCIALKLGVSGTALPIAETRLYKGSYGFVKLQVYVPKTQNTNAPLCTAFCTTTDELGREKISSKNYNLVYVGEFDLEGKNYLLFESLLPKEFTQKATTPNGLKITFNYFDTEITTDESGEAILDENGVPKRHATDLLVSSVYTTTVYSGGWNNEDIELNINSAEAAQINENARNISEIQDDIFGLQADTRAINSGLEKEVERATKAEENLDKKIGDLSKEAVALGKDVGQVNKTVEQLGKSVTEVAKTANEANKTASGLASRITEANKTAEKASETAATAVATAGEAKRTVESVSKNISEYKGQIDKKVADLEKNVVQGGGGSNILVDGKPQAQVEFDADPQALLDLKPNVYLDRDREMVLKDLKQIYQSYADSLIGTEDEVSEEELEQLFQEIEQQSTDDLLGALIKMQQMKFLPNEFGGFGLTDNLKLELLYDDGSSLCYDKLLASRTNNNDIKLMDILVNMKASKVNVTLANYTTGESLSGSIKLISKAAIMHSDSSYGWVVGGASTRPTPMNANDSSDQFGVYLAEFTYRTPDEWLIGCSLCVNHGSGITSNKIESYTPFIVDTKSGGTDSTNVYIKVCPYREVATGKLKLQIENITESAGQTSIVEPTYVKFYQII